jgi:hypothetical protein
MDRNHLQFRERHNMRTLKIGGLVFAAIMTYWFAGLAVEVLSSPSSPGYYKQVVALEERAAQVVDQQWSRPDSVPTPEDRAHFEAVINETAAIQGAEAPEAMKQFKAADVALRWWYAKYMEREMRRLRLYISLEPWTGQSAAEVIAVVVFGPGVAAAAYHNDRLAKRERTLRAPSRLISDLRYHYAMALVFAGDNAGAVLRLRAIIKDDPEFALVNYTYMIGGRAGALNDPDFCKEFAAAGGSLDRLRDDYSGAHAAKLYPYITPRNMTAYPPR